MPVWLEAKTPFKPILPAVTVEPIVLFTILLEDSVAVAPAIAIP